MPPAPEQPPSEPVPLDGFADRVRDAMGLRAQELEALRPEALDLAAQVVAALHDGLHGEATAHRGNRGANYFRQQLRGEHPISIEDLSRLALEAPGPVLAALTVLARALRYEMQPLVPTPSSNLHLGWFLGMGGIRRLMEGPRRRKDRGDDPNAQGPAPTGPGSGISTPS